MTAQIEAVDELVVAFGNKDLERFGRHIHPKFTWYNQDGEVQVQGADAFLSMISNLWKVNPDVKNTSSPCIEIGKFVSHTEIISNFSDQNRKDKWLWVYEFSEGKILNMYGYIN